MGLLLLLGGLVAIAGGIAGLGLSSGPTQLRGFDATSAAVLVMGGLIVVGLSCVVGRLQRIAEAIETQAFHEPSPALNEIQIPAATRMGAAAVAAALGDLTREAEPVRAAPEPVIAPLPPEPVLMSVPPPSPPPSPLAEAPEPTIEPVRAAQTVDAAPPLPPVTPPNTAELEPAFGEIRRTEWPTIDAGDRLQPEPPISGPVPPPISHSPTPPEPAPRARPAPPPAVDSFALGLEAVGSHLSPEPQSAAGPQVLKSGVIEGMAYTLYADGSVDAELPAGTRHFASIAEWRTYLREGSAA